MVHKNCRANSAMEKLIRKELKFRPKWGMVPWFKAADLIGYATMPTSEAAPGYSEQEI